MRSNPRNGHVWSTWLEDEESCQVVFFTTISWEGPTRDGLAKVSIWQKVVFCFMFSLPTLYLASLPTYSKECFLERKPEKIHLRVRDCYTHNHLHIFLWFSLTPTSPSLDLWEVASPNSYHTHIGCKVRFWCCWEALEGAIHWRMQLSWIVGFEKLEKTRLWEVRW